MHQASTILDGSTYHIVDLCYPEGPRVVLDHVTRIQTRAIGNVAYLAVTCTPPKGRPTENYEINMDDLVHWQWKEQDVNYSVRRSEEMDGQDLANNEAQRVAEGGGIKVIHVGDLMEALRRAGN